MVSGPEESRASPDMMSGLDETRTIPDIVSGLDETRTIPDIVSGLDETRTIPDMVKLFIKFRLCERDLELAKDRLKTFPECKVHISEMEEINFQDPRLVMSKADAQYMEIETIFDFFKGVQPEDIHPWPRRSLLTSEWTDTKTIFLQLEFPEEMAKLAADEKRAEYQDKYRKFFFPEIYAAEEFSRLVKWKLLEKRNGEKVKRAKLLRDIENSKMEKDRRQGKDNVKEEEKYDEKEDEKEMIKIEDVVLVTSDKAEKRKCFLSCFCF
ncbi:uncharacterized protein LOC117324576 [Pecten maximus]|uniref:uncharacterized protein LOC117324576 n=1 Tax=Pecten maximus TaxID=6579 RepID=UPI00145856F1|nr:uncharacterized protein LOC117324576 [Pecten maximus]